MTPSSTLAYIFCVTKDALQLQNLVCSHYKFYYSISFCINIPRRVTFFCSYCALKITRKIIKTTKTVIQLLHIKL